MPISVPTYEEIEKDLRLKGVEDKDFAATLQESVGRVVNQAIEKEIEQFRGDFREYRRRRARQEAFTQRLLLERWENSISGIWELCDIVERYCEVHMQSSQAAIVGNTPDPLSWVFWHMMPRGILVTREVIHLLRGGFPDAALARWRTLYEINISAFYMKKHGESAAERYLASMDFAERIRIQDFFQSAPKQPVDTKNQMAIKELKARCEAHKTKYAIKADKEGLWPKILGFDSIKQLEQAVGTSAMRPHYVMASEWTHAYIVPPGKMLASIGADTPQMLTGESIEGLAVPLSQASRGLAFLSSLFFSVNQTVTSEVMKGAVMILADLLDAVIREDEQRAISVDRIKELFPDWEEFLQFRPLDQEK